MLRDTADERGPEAAAPDGEAAPPHPRARLLRIAGWICVGLGAIGAVLPLMPTTIFLILAVACFMRADPELARRLLEHPRYGPSIRAWRERGIVSRKAKIAAVVAMAAGLALSWALGAPTMVLAGTAAILIPVATWLVLRPED
ncbi:YbaN family protein [Tistrella mobilis]|uniref:YbaN family protein n=1 Tax=Tistrella mobilis TaxID=171437 RepID=UPI0009ECCA5E|nr:YbaN family protein [Tistrella mobilis]